MLMDKDEAKFNYSYLLGGDCYYVLAMIPVK